MSSPHDAAANTPVAPPNEDNEVFGDRIFVCHVRDFASNRKSFMVGDREFAIFKLRDQYYALDGRCYHAGGPLADGSLTQIEDLDRRPCVVCPWHSYKIMLDNGESIYRGFGPQGEVSKSKGLKQRVHRIEVEAGNVYLRISAGGGKRDSDFYSSDEYRQMMQGRRSAAS